MNVTHDADVETSELNAIFFIRRIHTRKSQKYNPNVEFFFPDCITERKYGPLERATVCHLQKQAMLCISREHGYPVHQALKDHSGIQTQSEPTDIPSIKRVIVEPV